jgi:hypothetical protein
MPRNPFSSRNDKIGGPYGEPIVGENRYGFGRYTKMVIPIIIGIIIAGVLVCITLFQM